MRLLPHEIDALPNAADVRDTIEQETETREYDWNEALHVYATCLSDAEDEADDLYGELAELVQAIENGATRDELEERCADAGNTLERQAKRTRTGHAESTLKERGLGDLIPQGRILL